VSKLLGTAACAYFVIQRNHIPLCIKHASKVLSLSDAFIEHKRLQQVVAFSCSQAIRPTNSIHNNDISSANVTTICTPYAHSAAIRTSSGSRVVRFATQFRQSPNASCYIALCSQVRLCTINQAKPNHTTPNHSVPRS
jgi:hypothetical protein